jgi:purine-binding chemotaxis protein CheW
MAIKPYLIFSQTDVCYAVEASVVQEIFPLPELITVEEAPQDIVGILNLRSKILPVMQLDLRLGRVLQECRLSDNVIVINGEGFQFGLIVNQVHGIEQIEAERIEGELDYGREIDRTIRFLSGVAKVETDLILLLSPEKLIRDTEAIAALPVTEELLSEDQDSAENHQFERGFYTLCCPNATVAEREIFRQRAQNLQLRAESDSAETTGLMPLAVIGLNGEYFGFELETVREFTKIHCITPIPCCPAHVIGHMNLRGEIVTLVDIGQALNLPSSSVKANAQAVIITIDDMVAGLPVDEVLDVMYLHPSAVGAIPSTVQANENYLRGTVPYADRMLTILNLPNLFSAGRLVVEEAV